MNVTVEPVDVWAANIKDKPGGLANVLSTLHEAGADLEFIIARRSPDEQEGGKVFVTPLVGDQEIEAATTLGFNITNHVRSVRIEGENEAGIGAKISEMIAEKDINIKGLSAAVIGTRFIMYVGLDNATDAHKVISVLQQADIPIG